MSRFLAAGIAVCLALSACTGTPGAEPSPSASATSAGTLTPSASDPAQDPLYLEAVGVYKAYLVEILKLERAGGAEELPQGVTEFLAEGTYVTKLRDLYRELLGTGEQMAPSPDPELSVRPLPGVELEGSDIAIEACVDATGVDQLDGSGRVVHQGALLHRQVFFVREPDGQLKILGVVGEVVKVCPF